jgi:hypothetical protein
LGIGAAAGEAALAAASSNRFLVTCTSWGATGLFEILFVMMFSLYCYGAGCFGAPCIPCRALLPGCHIKGVGSCSDFFNTFSLQA